MNALRVYDDRYIKTKIRKHGGIIYTIFCYLNVPEDGAECKSFAINSIHFLLVYEKKYYLQVYLDNCAYKILNTQMADYLGDNLSESD